MRDWFLLYDGHDSKTTDKCGGTLALAEALGRLGLRVGGFVQRRVFDAHGEVAGWDVEAVAGSERRALARESSRPERCKWGFEQQTFRWASELATQAGLDVVFVGGVGHLECASRGHWPLIENLLGQCTGAPVVLTVRRSCIANIVLRSPDPKAALELPATPEQLGRFACLIRTAASNAGRSTLAMDPITSGAWFTQRSDTTSMWEASSQRS